LNVLAGTCEVPGLGQVQRHQLHGPGEFRPQPERLQVELAPRLEIAVILGHDMPKRHVGTRQRGIELERTQRSLPRLTKPLGRSLDVEDHCQRVRIRKAGARQRELRIAA
jgi:hypothetical protein